MYGLKSRSKGTFLHPDFLLETGYAKRLYHDFAKDLPIIDYHNHLPPEEISSDKKFENLTAIWLKGDHYKWRAMRALGVAEKYITGNATDEEKFLQWAKVVPLTLRNPLFHWTQLELLNPFMVEEYLNEKTATSIYRQCNDLLKQDNFSTRSLLHHFKVHMVGTTDDPCDSLQHHQQLAVEEKRFKVLPTFRPDNILNISNPIAWFSYLQKLESAAQVEIHDIPTLLEALRNRIEYFHLNGCTGSDHGLSHIPLSLTFSTALENEFAEFIASKGSRPFSQPENFAGYILVELSKMYHSKGWVQQFHLGALRNNNSRMMRLLGPDSGFDSIGDYNHALSLRNFLNELDKTDQLTKTILYNLNPSDNEVFATMAGNFNDGSMRGKIQYGAAWWFLDQKEGMEKQLNVLSNMGLISTFIGMLTDSRSFLSYSRHEYFRRILCNLFGKEMQSGELPEDEKWVGEIVQDICYYNAKNYFNL